MVSFRVFAARPMLAQPNSGGPLIDGFAFADAGKSLLGRWMVHNFARLRDLVSSDEGELSYEVAGTRDEVGRPAVRLKVSGTLQLTCQRCLKALPFPLEVEAVLVLAKSEAEIE